MAGIDDSAAMPEARRQRSLAETAYDAIEQMIISRRLAPGAMAKGRADRFNRQYTLLQLCNWFALRRVDPVCRVDSEGRGKAEAHR